MDVQRFADMFIFDSFFSSQLRSKIKLGPNNLGTTDACNTA